MSLSDASADFFRDSSLSLFRSRPNSSSSFFRFCRNSSSSLFRCSRNSSCSFFNSHLHSCFSFFHSSLSFHHSSRLNLAAISFVPFAAEVNALDASFMAWSISGSPPASSRASPTGARSARSEAPSVSRWASPAEARSAASSGTFARGVAVPSFFAPSFAS